MTDINKLADAFHPASPQPSDKLRMELCELLRAAAGVDVAGLLELAAKAIYDSWYPQPGFVAWVPGGNSHKQTEARDIARAALESSLRLVLAQRVPTDQSQKRESP